MGSSLKLIDQAPAGSIVGIGGLEEVLVKTGTISTDENCPNFTKSGTISMGLIKVAIETDVLSDMDKLKQGLINSGCSFILVEKGKFSKHLAFF